ncbi:exodeoxyribonuclease VII large subunit [Acetobacter sp. AN02]|uniref:exodeoxyribonuclease VII large subunit n=1 Tax=Acetobacter sp. AN02 TaxID=2894186 RepID=UPI00243445D6|nr:exodeoxyribonuclease VII large subunit [Acetobacter sp. AN02]MDG6095181.1 exodeoxyribonuclease VII large subunit [Acetobacter sp. AN02]
MADVPSEDSARTAPGRNTPEFTVSEISGAIKRTLEGTFGRVRVRGEITEFKRYASGHLYFSLKDEGGKISGVVWRGSVSRLGLVPENGLEIIATGKVSSYGERSGYQLIVERMEYAGEGAMLARIERLRQKLAAEGLFDEARKRPFPLLPEIVGVVTSAQGAVLHDIRTTIARRFPRRILVWPVAVQGEGAAAQIAAAIEGFGALPPDGPVPRPDVLIVARGGGSLEDLMAFNDEAVVRAAAACPIPLLSAVGHETDTTLIDFASDRRAPTPTAAAEMAVPVRLDLLAQIEQRAAAMAGGLARLCQTGRMRLDRAVAGLPDLSSVTDTARMRLDDRIHRLEMALPSVMALKRSVLVETERHLPVPLALITQRAGKLALAGSELGGAIRRSVERSAASCKALRLPAGRLEALCREDRLRLEALAGRLESVSPQSVLARGYAMVTDDAGHPVTTAASLSAGKRVTLSFADGQKAARIEGQRKETSQQIFDF